MKATSSFSVILCAVVAAAITSGAAAARKDHHECVHDSPQLQRQQARLLQRNGAAVQAYAPSVHTQGGRLFHAQQAQPIRIVFSYEDLTEPGAFCASTAGTAPSYLTEGETVSCNDPTHVLNSTKIALLQNIILPAALRRLQNVLSVEPVTAPLSIRAAACGGDFTIPPSHTTTGVPDADLVIYTASSPIPGSTVAFAGACQRDQNGRAIAGLMNFGTENIEWSATTPADNQLLVDTAVHEILHILGVTSTELHATGRVQQGTKRGKTVRMVTTPSVRSFVRQWSGCSTLEGAEVEDEQTSGPEGSHWERKLFYDELMCGVVGTKLSMLSLGFLHDMNVGYTVDFTGAETMRWGANDGCGPHLHRCNTAAGLRDKYFCFADPATTQSEPACTWDYASVGFCHVGTSTSAFPQAFQYYTATNVGGASPFMDGCPIVAGYSNRRCNVDTPESADDVILGHTFSQNGRCLVGTGIIQSGFSSTRVDGPRCVEVQCTSADVVSFRVGGSGSYTQCGAAGSTQPATSGYNGQVTCPDPVDFCSHVSAVVTFPPEATTPADGSVPGGPTPPPTPGGPTATTAAESGGTVKTVRGDLFFAGSSFTSLRADEAAWTELQAALVGDIAAGLVIASSDVEILAIGASVSGLSVDFAVRVNSVLVSAAVERIASWQGSSLQWGRSNVVYRRFEPGHAGLTSGSASASPATAPLVASVVPPLMAAIAVALALGL